MSGSVFFTSDLHIGHRFIAGTRWNRFAARTGGQIINPRDATEEHVRWHDDTLAKNWDRLINPNGDRGDQVWVLGDTSVGGDKSQKRALAWLMERGGRKHLIAGNHDSCHPMHRDAHKWQQTYMGVFESVQAFARRRIAGQAVLLSHFPYIAGGDADWADAERYPQWRLPNMGEWLLHGHVHTEARVQGRSIHVGVDAWDLTPIPLNVIEGIIRGSDELSRQDLSVPLEPAEQRVDR